MNLIKLLAIFAVLGIVDPGSALGAEAPAKEYNWGVIISVFIAIGIYWFYCLYWGIVGWKKTKTGAGWAIAGRSLPGWLFLLAASATSFSAWTYIGHPGTVYTGGLAYAFAGLYAITIPFTGALFIKRQWMLGRRFGFVTPPDQYRAIFDSRPLVFLIVAVSFLYSIFYVAVQLVGSGLLFNVLTGGFIPYFLGSIFLAVILVFYVAAGGLRTIAWVDALQFFLLVGGIAIIGGSVMYGMGGWYPFMEKISALPAHWTKSHDWIHVGWNWVQPSADGIKRAQWSGVMMFSYMFALAGIQCSPAFTMWAYSLKRINLLPWQVTYGIGTIVMVTLVLWSVVQGMGGQWLAQTNPGEWGPKALLSYITGAGGRGAPSDALVPRLMLTYIPLGLLPLTALGLLAAAQSTGAPYISSFAAIASRNLIGGHLIRKKRTELGDPNAIVTLDMVISQESQLFWARFFCVFIVSCAFVVAYINPDLIVMLGGLAVSYAFQLIPALLMICYVFKGWPNRWSGDGIFWGLLMGIIFVTISYWFPAYRYPLTIHCAGWGIIFNLLTIIIVSAFTTPSPKMVAWADRLNDFYRTHDTAFYAPKARSWQKFLIFYIPFWWLMFVGPGIEIGNYLDGIALGLPGQWLWLIIGGISGTFLLWSMCWGACMATHPTLLPEPIDEEAAKTIKD